MTLPTNTIPADGTVLHSQPPPLKTPTIRNQLATKLEPNNDKRARQKHHLHHNFCLHRLMRFLLPCKEGYLADRLSRRDGS
jgi:hypothetical protein